MQRRDAKHLATQVITRNENVPSYALLLGSGASISSGVKTAEQMVVEWRGKLFQQAATAQPFSEWVANQPWHGGIDEYGKLFEFMHDLPNQRRIVVEDLLKDAEPSWGYAYLANLLDRNYFNVILTTNFDDLLTEACYRFTNAVRPLVATHDSTIRNLRVTSTRPKIVKLHGDFLYDNIKNTPSETASLELNTHEKLHQFAREYGLITIGYSGRDVSVMKSLETLLEDDTSFPNGIYWCVQELSRELPVALQRIAEDNRVYFVEIEGFDEILAEFHSAARLGLPAGLSAIFEFARDRASLLIDVDRSRLDHPVIEEDVAHVMDGLSRIPEIVSEVLPVELLASLAEHRGNEETALGWRQQVYDANKSDVRAARHVLSLLVKLGEIDRLQELVRSAPLGENATYWHLLAGNDGEVIRIADDELAKNPYREVTRINKAIALKRLGCHERKEVELIYLQRQVEDGLLTSGTSSTALRAGIEALWNNREQSFELLEGALNRREVTAEEVWQFPVFEDYRDDEEFQAIVNSMRRSNVVQSDMEPGAQEG